MKGSVMRTYTICAAAVVAAAFLGACSDGSAGLGTPAATAGSPSTSGDNPTVGTGGDNTTSNVPTGGSGGTPTPGTETINDNLPIAEVDPMGNSGGTGNMPVPGAGGSTGGEEDDGLKQGPFKILVLTTTLEFPHDSIAVGNQMLNDLGQASAPERANISGLAPDATWTVDQMIRDGGDPNYFSEITAENLAQYDVVYSNNPTGPVFTNAPDSANKKAVFQTWFESGGAWAGHHSATDFEKDNRWTWFTENVAGGWFVDHDDDNTPGTVSTQPQFAEHPIVNGLASPWNTTDEWYLMNRNIEGVPGFNILAKVTVSSSRFPGGTQARPAIWTTENEGGGRAFYTIKGHNRTVFAEPQFRQLMLRGILWSAHRLPGGN